MPSLREETETTFTLAAIIVELNEETLHSTFETLDLLQKNNELMLLSCINATAMTQIITILSSNTTIESAAEITLP